MNYTGTIYRPPFEADSLLLQVTVGCSHNKCSFCYMYPDVPFSVSPLFEVEADIDEAARLYPNVERVFLENGDAFVLSADKLEHIADMIHKKLPRVETISMYASIQNIRGKSDEDLRRLRQCGINELNIGTESGLDEALIKMNKGHTAKESIHELRRLKDAGMDYGLNIILGGAGSELIHENARASAELLNATQPYLVFVGTLHTEHGCSLHEEMVSGVFPECNYGQLLDEQEEMLEALELDKTFYFGLHPSNVVPMQGWLPEDKDALLKTIRKARKNLKNRLSEVPIRGGEGSILR